MVPRDHLATSVTSLQLQNIALTVVKQRDVMGQDQLLTQNLLKVYRRSSVSRIH